MNELMQSIHEKIQPSLQCSDKGTIERLYKKMAKAAIAKAASIVRRQDVAAEIAHDTFFKLWQSGPTFPNEKAVYVWIYRTCHRAAIDYLRSASHRRESFAGENLDEMESVPASRYGDIVMTRQLVQAAIQQLKPDEVEAFLYVALDGMTQNEVAEVMELSRRTVQRLLEKVEIKFQEVRRRDASGS